MKNLLKQQPFQILFFIIMAIVLTPLLSKNILGIFYSFSCIFKDALMLFLPLLIFSFMFSAMLKFSKSAPMLILAIVITVTLSNALAFIVSFFLSKFALSFLNLSSGITLSVQIDPLQSLTNLPIPEFWTPKNGMIFGFAAGIILSIVKNDTIYQLSEILKEKLTQIFNKYFIPLLPLFIFGFFVKLQYEGIMLSLITGYGKTLLIIVPIFLGYLMLLFLITNQFHIGKTIQHIKDSTSAIILGFSTMSSLATLPLMIKTAQKHVPQKDYAEFMVPSTVNIHAIGDGLIFASSIVSILYMFHAPFPSFGNLMHFLYYYVLARFSTAGVPGGSTIVIMPLTIAYLGFSYQMAALFMTIDILLDCLCTPGNVIGNILYATFSYNIFGKRLLK